MHWYFRKIALKLAWFFVPGRKLKQRFYEKYHLWASCVPVCEADDYVPKSVLAKMKDTAFAAGGGAILAA